MGFHCLPTAPAARQSPRKGSKKGMVSQEAGCHIVAVLSQPIMFLESVVRTYSRRLGGHSEAQGRHVCCHQLRCLSYQPLANKEYADLRPTIRPLGYLRLLEGAGRPWKDSSLGLVGLIYMHSAHPALRSKRMVLIPYHHGFIVKLTATSTRSPLPQLYCLSGSPCAWVHHGNHQRGYHAT